jgi:hypothetical protein
VHRQPAGGIGIYLQRRTLLTSLVASHAKYAFRDHQIPPAFCLSTTPVALCNCFPCLNIVLENGNVDQDGVNAIDGA